MNSKFYKVNFSSQISTQLVQFNHKIYCYLLFMTKGENYLVVPTQQSDDSYTTTTQHEKEYRATIAPSLCSKLVFASLSFTQQRVQLALKSL